MFEKAVLTERQTDRPLEGSCLHMVWSDRIQEPGLSLGLWHGCLKAEYLDHTLWLFSCAPAGSWLGSWAAGLPLVPIWDTCAVGGGFSHCTELPTQCTSIEKKSVHVKERIKQFVYKYPTTERKLFKLETNNICTTL